MSAVAQLETNQKQAIAKGLETFLADSYTLYVKTHNFHWNVTGPNFAGLHLMFETQYTELQLAVDLIAERIRALGFPAPAGFAEFLKRTSIKEAVGVPKAKEMIRQLLQDNEAVAKSAQAAFPAAEEAGDQATMDLLTQRIQAHEKAAWMLRSQLED